MVPWGVAPVAEVYREVAKLQDRARPGVNNKYTQLHDACLLRGENQVKAELERKKNEKEAAKNKDM